MGSTETFWQSRGSFNEQTYCQVQSLNNNFNNQQRIVARQSLPWSNVRAIRLKETERVFQVFQYSIPPPSSPLGARCSSAVRAFAHGAMGCRIDPLSYFSFQPVHHDWCTKSLGICYPIYSYKRTLVKRKE